MGGRRLDLRVGNRTRLIVMPDQKPKLDYSSSDETRFSERDGAGRYFRELPSMETVGFFIASFVVLTLTICVIVLYKRIFP